MLGMVLGASRPEEFKLLRIQGICELNWGKKCIFIFTKIIKL